MQHRGVIGGLIWEAQTVCKKLHYFTLTGYERFCHVLNVFFNFSTFLNVLTFKTNMERFLYLRGYFTTD